MELSLNIGLSEKKSNTAALFKNKKRKSDFVCSADRAFLRSGICGFR